MFWAEGRAKRRRRGRYTLSIVFDTSEFVPHWQTLSGLTDVGLGSSCAPSAWGSRVGEACHELARERCDQFSCEEFRFLLFSSLLIFAAIFPRAQKVQ